MTSISVVRDDDPEDMKEKYQKEYEQYSVENVVATATDPKFKLYLYNAQGELVQENLSIHDIQHLLLHQTRRRILIPDEKEVEEPDKSDNDLQEQINSVQDLYKNEDRNKPLKDLYKTSKPAMVEEVLDLTPLGKVKFKIYQSVPDHLIKKCFAHSIRFYHSMYRAIISHLSIF